MLKDTGSSSLCSGHRERSCTRGLLAAGTAEGNVEIVPSVQLLLVFWAVTSDSVFFDFFVIYTQNGFFREASESLQATHFFKLCHGSTSLFRVKGWSLSGIYLHFPPSVLPSSARGAGLRGCAPLPVPWPLGEEREAHFFFFFFLQETYSGSCVWQFSKKSLCGEPGRVRPVITPNNPVTTTALPVSRTPAFQIAECKHPKLHRLNHFRCTFLYMLTALALHRRISTKTPVSLTQRH